MSPLPVTPAAPPDTTSPDAPTPDLPPVVVPPVEPEQPVDVRRCPEITIAPRYGYAYTGPATNPDELWTCSQRDGHLGEHNRSAPDILPERVGGCSCTAWADHCPTCAAHTCRCSVPA